jgi:hypothetical protein
VPSPTVFPSHELRSALSALRMPYANHSMPRRLRRNASTSRCSIAGSVPHPNHAREYMPERMQPIAKCDGTLWIVTPHLRSAYLRISSSQRKPGTRYQNTASTRLNVRQHRSSTTRLSFPPENETMTASVCDAASLST